jgi:hypothetical protein
MLSATMPVAGTVSILLAISAGLFRKIEVTPLLFVGLAIGAITAVFPYLRSDIGIGYPSNIATADSQFSVRVPLDGEVVVAWGGDRVSTNYHAAYADQRWAYDLVVEPHSRKFQSLEEYGCFGKAVLAPVEGQIKTASDEMNDEPAGSEGTTSGNVFGNYIVLQPTGKKTRLIIAHLKSESIVVQEDEIVQEGQPIAQCGNSGSSTEPHVHIHYIDLVNDGDETHMIGLPLFFRDNYGPSMPVGGFSVVAGEEIASGDRISHIGKDDE